MPKQSVFTASARSILHGRGNFAAATQTVLIRLLALGLNAATSIIVARILKAQGRGEMSALIIWSGMLTGMVTFGLPSSLVFNLRHKPERASSTMGAGLVLTVLISIAVGAIGYAIVPITLTHYSARDILYARWFLLSSPIPIVSFVARAAMEAEGKFTFSNVVAWSCPVLTLVGLVGLAAAHHLTPVTGGLAYVLSAVPSMVWLVVKAWQDYAPNLHGLANSASDLLKYGVRSWGIDLLNALAGQADLVLIVRFLNSDMMGTYVVAEGFARLLSVFQTSAATILFPRVAARESSEVVSLTGKAVRITMACTVAGAIVMAFTGSSLLRMIYGAEYAEKGTLVFRVLLCEVVIGGATDVLAQAFMALGRPGIVSTIQAVGIGIGLSLMPLLIQRFGIVGAGIALLISTSIRFCLTLLCFRPILRTKPPNLVMDRSDFDFAAHRIAGFAAASQAVVE